MTTDTLVFFEGIYQLYQFDPFQQEEHIYSIMLTRDGEAFTGILLSQNCIMLEAFATNKALVKGKWNKKTSCLELSCQFEKGGLLLLHLKKKKNQCWGSFVNCGVRWDEWTRELIKKDLFFD